MAEIKVTIYDGAKKYSYMRVEDPKKGSCGQVYKGVEESTGTEVAIKIYKKSEGKDAFYEREINAMNGLKAENSRYVLKMLSCFEDEEHKYIITNFCEQGTVKEFLMALGPLDYRLAIEAIYQLARGVEDLHNKGYLHLDLTLENILISNGRCKIGDFGSAKKAEEFNPCYQAAPSYKAPEVKKNRGDIDKDVWDKFCYKLDIWSIGIIFYKMLFGKFAYLHNEELLQNKFIKDRFPPNKLPRKVIHLLDKMLKLDYNERYDIREVLRHRLFRNRLRVFVPYDKSQNYDVRNYFLIECH